MKTSTHPHLPLAPLLHAYLRAGVPTLAELHRLSGLGPRFAAILSATAKFLYLDFVENASANEWTDALVRFREQIRRHAEMMFRALRERGALADCRCRERVCAV